MVKVSGYYPNRLDRFISLEARQNGRRVRRGEGYRPYSADGLLIRDTDVPFLLQKDQAEAAKYLDLIRKAKAKDKSAEMRLKERQSQLFEREKLVFQNTPRPGSITQRDDTLPYSSVVNLSPKSSEEVSLKGAWLQLLRGENYPVPELVIITAETTEKYFIAMKNGLEDETATKKLAAWQKGIGGAIEHLESLTGGKLGKTETPLVVALRAAMQIYLPGILPTYLSVGITEESLPPLETLYGRTVARSMYLNNLENLLRVLDPEKFCKTPKKIEQLTEAIRKIKPELLLDPMAQARFFCEEICREVKRKEALIRELAVNEPHFYGPKLAIIVQEMVPIAPGGGGIAGVALTHDSVDGTQREVQYARDVFGEAVMSGTHQTKVERLSPDAEGREDIGFNLIGPLLTKQEGGVPHTLEFGIFNTPTAQLLALFQFNNSELPGRAMIIAAMNSLKEGKIRPQELFEMISQGHLAQINRPQVDKNSLAALKKFGEGAPVLPYISAAGRVYFTSVAAQQAKENQDSVCLIKQTSSPDDAQSLAQVDALGVIDPAGIHVVTAARREGKPGILGLGESGVRFNGNNELVNANGDTLKEGGWITIDGGVIYKGKVAFHPFSTDSDQALATALEEFREVVSQEKELILKEMNSKTRVWDVYKLLLNLETVSVSLARELLECWIEENEETFLSYMANPGTGEHGTRASLKLRLTPGRRAWMETELWGI